MEIEIIVPGEPKPQARARARAFFNAKVRPEGKWMAQTYDPKGPSADYRARIAHEAALVMDGRSFLNGPIEIAIAFWITKPKSKPKYKSFPDVTPDLDNYVKAVLDGLRKIIFRDDAQVCCLRAQKAYCMYGNTPKTEIWIRVLEEGRFKRVDKVV